MTAIPSSLLREARLRTGRTQADVAAAAGTSAATLSAYERGRVSPSLETADRLLVAMGEELTTRPRFVSAAVNYGTYRGRPIELPSLLPRVQLRRAFGRVTLPLHLQWSPRGREFDLAERPDRLQLYEAVLREGGPDDIGEWIDPHLLVDLFARPAQADTRGVAGAPRRVGRSVLSTRQRRLPAARPPTRSVSGESRGAGNVDPVTDVAHQVVGGP